MHVISFSQEGALDYLYPNEKLVLKYQDDWGRNNYKKVFNSPNLIGIFTGHIHKNSIQIIKGKPQIVSDDNASGAYLDIDFMPLKEEYKNIT